MINTDMHTHIHKKSYDAHYNHKLTKLQAALPRHTFKTGALRRGRPMANLPTRPCRSTHKLPRPLQSENIQICSPSVSSTPLGSSLTAKQVLSLPNNGFMLHLPPSSPIRRQWGRTISK